MTANQKRLRELREKQSKDRQKMAELAQVDELSDEQRSELDTIEKSTPDQERQIRAATVAVEDEEKEAETRAADQPDAELRECIELRSRARLTNYLTAFAQGRLPTGAESELSAAAGVEQIPVELFGMSTERRLEQRADVATGSPSTTGINLDPIYPLIYARAVLPRLSVAMPRISSGTFATATYNVGLTAVAKAKGEVQEATAATMAVVSSGPHRVTARLSLRLEDIAEIGVDNFESSARLQLMLAQSAELDRLGLVGDPATVTDEPEGLLTQQTAPGTAPTAVADFNAFVDLAAGAIDGGPWAEGLDDVKLLVNAETARLAERTFQTAASYQGEMAAGAYLRDKSGGFFSSARMPDTDGTDKTAAVLRVRASTMGLDGVNAMRLATCGVYAEVGVDDIFSSSAAGIRHFTLHTLITDVLIQQADGFDRVDVKVAA